MHSGNVNDATERLDAGAGGVEDALTVDDAALQRAAVELMLQVNGKLRGSITVPADADRDAIEAAALASADVQRFAEGRSVRRVIVVPGRLVNVVV